MGRVTGWPTRPPAMKRLRAWPVRLAGNALINPNAGAVVSETATERQKRLAQALRALGGRTLDAYAVARRLTWTRRETPFASLDDFNQMLAVNETAAHLDVLVLRGRATMAFRDGVNQYTRLR